MKEFRWEGIRTIKGIKGKLKRAALQFTPSAWEAMDYDPIPRHNSWESYKRCFIVYMVVGVMILSELSSFFLKHIFRVPTDNMLNCYRLLIHVAMGAPAMRQYYIYITNPECQRWGAQLLATVAVLITELLVCIRFGKFLRPTDGKLMPIFNDTAWKPAFFVMGFT